MKKLLSIYLLWSLPSNSFVVYDDTKIWDQNAITFYFSDGTPKQKSEVKRFAKLWQRYTHISFHYTDKKPGFFTFKKYYTITFKGHSNQSTRGAVNGTIQLGNLSDNIIYRKATILHEFGHMLGLGHEHQRSDRPAWLNNDKLIQSCIKTQQQSQSWCQENLSDIETTKVFIESEYDKSSIMHYAAQNIVGNDKDLLNAIDATSNNTLSYTDKYFIALLYNQNIIDETLEKMHQQDLWEQQRFEIKENKKRENAIAGLKTSSCKTLKHPQQSLDGKYCEKGFMIIGSDDYSYPEAEFKTCYTSFKQIKEKMQHLDYCQLSPMQLTKKRKQWSNQFSQYGQCKRLETHEKNRQEYFCEEGYSFVSKNNDMIGDKTECFASIESVYHAMKNNRVCNLDDFEFRQYQQDLQEKTTKQLTTKHCQIVKKSYKTIKCPKDYDFTIINRKNPSKPINEMCFDNQFQAINAMQSIPFCKS